MHGTLVLNSYLDPPLPESHIHPCKLADMLQYGYAYPTPFPHYSKPPPLDCPSPLQAQYLCSTLTTADKAPNK